MDLKDILCPRCGVSCKVGNLKRRTNTGFSNIKCKNDLCNVCLLGMTY